VGDYKAWLCFLAPGPQLIPSGISKPLDFTRHDTFCMPGSGETKPQLPCCISRRAVHQWWAVPSLTSAATAFPCSQFLLRSLHVVPLHFDSGLHPRRCCRQRLHRGQLYLIFGVATLTNLHLAYRWYLPSLLDEPRQPMQNRLAILIGTGEWVRCNTTGGSCSERGTSDAQGELGLGLMGDLMNFAGAFAVGDTSSPLLRTWMVSSQADITGSTLFVLIVFFVNIPPSYTFPYFVLVPSHQYNVRRAHHNNTSLSISTWKPWALHQLINSALCHEL